MMYRLQTGLVRLTAFLVSGIESLRTGTTDDDHDRGDVPGWVMITLMTAIVVIALLAVFQDQVIQAVRDAFASISE